MDPMDGAYRCRQRLKATCACVKVKVLHSPPSIAVQVRVAAVGGFFEVYSPSCVLDRDQFAVYAFHLPEWRYLRAVLGQ